MTDSEAMARLGTVLEAAGAATDLDEAPRMLRVLAIEQARVTEQFTAILAGEGDP